MLFAVSPRVMLLTLHPSPHILYFRVFIQASAAQTYSTEHLTNSGGAPLRNEGELLFPVPWAGACRHNVPVHWALSECSLDFCLDIIQSECRIFST